MPDIKEHIAYLSQEIGARPAGTEEEQQAALYITEQFQKEAGLPANIEDFNGVGDPHLPSMICCGAAVVLALLSLIVPVLSIIGVIGCLAAVGLFAAEYLDKPIISKLLGKGVSQNVVAKYAPAAPEDGEGARRRKVILVARYDTGKVRAELAGPTAQIMPLVGKVSFGAMVALPVLLLIKGVALGSSEGTLTTIFTLLTVIAMLLTAIPLALGALHQTAAYNEGANCNASGVAALLELAHRVGAGRVSEAEIAEREDALMHGPEAAYESGLVPEGAEFVYSSHPRSSMEDEESLIAAKAAISALSGKPVDGMTAEEVERNLQKIERHDREEAEEEARMQRMEARAIESARRDAEQARLAAEQEQQALEAQQAEEAEKAQAEFEAQQAAMQQAEFEAQQAAAQQAAAQQMQAAAEQQRAAQASVPDWYARAQEKAKKPRNAEKPAQRSRYASALDAAVAESAGHFAKANNIVEHELERSFDIDRDTIREVRAPQWATIAPVQPTVQPETEQSAVNAAPVNASVNAVSAVEQASQMQQAPVQEQPAIQTPAPQQAVQLDAQVETASADKPAPAAPQDDAAVAAPAPEASASVAEPAFEQAAAQQPVAQFAPAQVSAPEPVQAQVVAPAEVADPFATAATPPIDVTKLHLEDVPPMGDVPMPAFLDPRKVQEEAQSRQSDAPRSGNRVDVTQASINDAGRVDAANAPVVPMPAPASESADEMVPELQAKPLDIPDASVVPAAPVTLPEISATAPAAPVAAAVKQRAPLADVESAGKTAARSLLSLLPSIGSSDIKASHEQEGEEAGEPGEKKDPKPSLLASLPSLSGSIKAADAAQAQPGVNAAASFGTAGATGSFAPVSSELASTMDPEDMYVDDADDSAYDDHFTETGAFAGPGYMEMPKSRFRRLFDKFLHRKDDEEDTPQEWLDVDDNFEARAAGKARGGWESFQEEHYEQGEYQGDYAVEADQDAAAYPGATQALPALQSDDLGATQAWTPQPIDVEAAGQEVSQVAYDDSFNVDDVADNEQSGSNRFRPWHGGAYSARRMENSNLSSEELADEAAAAAVPTPVELNEELNEVYQFRNPDIDAEVWFVALGSELAQNSGMKAFLEAHQSELRGAFIVDIDAIGAGDLTMIEREGFLRPSKASSRMKRYIRKASQATGTKVASGALLGEESAASYAAKHGCQVTHLVGMEGGKPALYGQQDDIVENIDEKKLASNVDFLMELLKNM
ncbi:hypothetical protein [Senegalimassilia anaerobia]|uniref:hypothetical protein n=1 Tax=Senegalimassilia anaerobia TaxID=1473216 RepID=UPI00026D2C89|nr:hypothetical protein [Senegalimassilia anaerobia]